MFWVRYSVRILYISCQISNKAYLNNIRHDLKSKCPNHK